MNNKEIEYERWKELARALNTIFSTENRSTATETTISQCKTAYNNWIVE